MAGLRNPLPFSFRLSTDGSGGGTTNAIGNYSGAGDTEFYLAATNGDVIELHRMIVFIEDTGNLLADGYGAGSALTEGMTLALKDADDNVLSSLPFTIKTNAEWAAICHDLTSHDFGSGNNYITARWTFSRFGAPIVLKNGQKFVLTCRDNMSVLVSHYFTMQGIYVNREL